VIAVRPLAAADEAAWDTYVLAQPGSHFAQRTAWRTLTREFFGVEARWSLARDAAGRIVGALPLFRGKDALFSAPGGLLAEDDVAATALLEPGRADVARDGLRCPELRDQVRAADPELVVVLSADHVYRFDFAEAVATHRDVPGDRWYGLIHKDWPGFVAEGEEVRYVGDVIAAIAAVDQHTAKIAADLVEVEYEVLPAVTSTEAAGPPPTE